MLRTKIRHSLAGYVAAALIVLAAIGFRLAILPIEGGLAFAMFYPTTVLAFYLFGTGPGVFAVALSAAAGFYIFSQPYWSWGFHRPAAIAASVYVFSSSLIALLVMKMKRTAEDLGVALKQSRESSKRFDAMINSDLLGIAIAKNRTTVWCNREFERMFGFLPGEINRRPTRLLYLDDESYEKLGTEAYVKLQKGEQFRCQMQMARKDGSPIWVDVSGTDFSSGDGESLWMMLDISQMKNQHEEIELIAFHDALTGLPNRRLLLDRLQQAIALRERLDGLLAVCFMDLDGFKAVNDAHGHDAGDELLRIMASRIQRCVRENDTVARLGGDEFVLVLTHLSNKEECEYAIQRVLRAASKPVVLSNGKAVQVSTSMGVAFCPEFGIDADVLINQADAAMYKAKRAGRNQVQYG